MKKRYIILSFVLLPFLVTSCAPGIEVQVVNNTGEDLVVVSIDTELKETAYPLGNGQGTRIRTPYKLRVQHNGGPWDYDLRPIPRSFWKHIGINRYLWKYQIEKDGAVHVLLPDSQGPTTDLPSQPAGYPVRPK